MTESTSMHLVLLGLSHKTAPVWVRERAAFAPDAIPEAMRRLRNHVEVTECLILSTCNRTEILAVLEEGSARPEVLQRFLCEQTSMDADVIGSHVYALINEKAVEHVFRVCSALESMVVGETQIVSQVKDAYKLSCSYHCNGPLTNRLLHQAFRVSKRVRRSTRIGEGSLSVSFVACDLARRELGSLDGRMAILVGAGETGRLVARHLIERGIGRLAVTNRTWERAVNVAERFGAEAFPLDRLSGRLHEADILVTATRTDEPILTLEGMRHLLEERADPLVLIDLGMPRNVAPDVAQLETVRLHNIDDLQELVDSNRNLRHEEREKCLAIIREEVAEFIEWYRTHLASPIITELQAAYETLRVSEMSLLRSALSDESYDRAERATRTLVKKMLQRPILHALETARREDPVKAVRTLRQFFGLAPES